MQINAQETQRVTVHLPVHLLQAAQKITHQGITETIRVSLEQLAISKACNALRAARGKVKFSINIDELRDDSKANKRR